MNVTPIAPEARPLILDLFSGAGGAAKGYHDAGFDLVGIDRKAMPHYPFPFAKMEALALLRNPDFMSAFAGVHASPPCKTNTSLKHFSGKQHTDMIDETRELLDATGLPYVIENVVGAKHLRNPVMLCGSMFGLGVRRHRLFELGGWTMPQPRCEHKRQVAESPGYPVRRYHGGVVKTIISPVLGVYGGGQGLGEGEVLLWHKAMGIDWMTRRELAEAIPPAYTEHIGRALMAHLGALVDA